MFLLRRFVLKMSLLFKFWLEWRKEFANLAKHKRVSWTRTKMHHNSWTTTLKFNNHSTQSRLTLRQRVLESNISLVKISNSSNRCLLLLIKSQKRKVKSQFRDYFFELLWRYTVILRSFQNGRSRFLAHSKYGTCVNKHSFSSKWNDLSKNCSRISNNTC